MDLLSQLEVDRLKQTASSDIYQLFLQLLAGGPQPGSHTDSSKEILERFKSFDIHVIRRERGSSSSCSTPRARSSTARSSAASRSTCSPCCGTFSGVSTQLESNRLVNLTSSHPYLQRGVRHPAQRQGDPARRRSQPGGLLGRPPINEVEYQYTRAVGSELGLRELNICTGCGPGCHGGPHEGGRRRPRQAAGAQRPLHRSHRAFHRRRTAEPPSSTSW